MHWKKDGGRVRNIAPVLQPHVAVLLPHWCADFDQFGYTDTCPRGATARAGRKPADHSEKCRSRMEAILVTTTEEHMRLERARERFAQFAEETRCDGVSSQETSP